MSESSPVCPAESLGGPVAYLVNQYPKVSHSFIRREILALERRGTVVHRFALRGWDASVVDADDESERHRTRYVLREGAAALVAALLRAAIRSPSKYAKALALAWRIGRRAERPLPFHLIYLAEACILVDWLRDCGAVHLHAHFGTNGAEVAMLVRALGGPPYSFTVHGPEEFDKAPLLALAEKMTRASFVVAISSFGRSQLYRLVAPEVWRRIHVVHCGLDASFHRDGFRAPAATPRLVCVGRLCEQKGQLLLLDAAYVLARRGIPFELVLAGDGDMRAGLEAAIDRLGLREQVRITGWVDAAGVREEILAARALVLASFAEGLPVVLMEAMALGRPVVSTWVAGIPELVRDGVDGWLIPSGDVDALADALEACLAADVAQLAMMGARARPRVLEKHDVDASAARLAALFAASAAEEIAS